MLQLIIAKPDEEQKAHNRMLEIEEEVSKIAGRPVYLEEWDCYCWAQSEEMPDISKDPSYLPFDIVSPLFYSPVESGEAISAALGWRVGQEFSKETILWGNLSRGWMKFGVSSDDCAPAFKASFEILERY